MGGRERMGAILRVSPPSSAGRFLFCLILLLFSSIVWAAEEVPTRQVRLLRAITEAAGLPISLPTDVEIGPRGRIHLVDSGNHRLLVFSPDFELLFAIGGRGEREGEFDGPVGVGVGPRGRIYVADRNNRRVQVFGRDGNFRSLIPLKLDGRAIVPVDVAVAPSGTIIYVSGNNNHRVMAYTSGGRLLRHWGGEGTGAFALRYPATLDTDPEGRVFVVDVLNTRVQIYTREGRVSASIGEWGTLPGRLFRPKGVVVDDGGQAWVSDGYMGVIQVFDASTRFSHLLGDHGRPHLFDTPAGIALDPQGRLYVCEMLANRVGVYAVGE